VLFVNTQPPEVPGSHESFVQTLKSLHVGAGPPWHEPLWHWSPVVHSLHGLVLLVCTHPEAGLQLSVKQTLLVMQFGGGPPPHPPLLQASAVVHALLSLHGSLVLTCVQPVAGAQPSSVQPFESLQFTGTQTHTWATHR
jgi:hypothetical protein